ncbi:MAG TPA: addiction module protein [Verrucomicrobiales bacterium]|nr:addiction module protein [Verrucomicrobiales bacterium]
MIAERIPALASLSITEKWTLAVELLDEVERREGEMPVDEGILALVEERFARYEQGKDPGRPWSEVKAGLLSESK